MFLMIYCHNAKSNDTFTKGWGSHKFYVADDLQRILLICEVVDERDVFGHAGAIIKEKFLMKYCKEKSQIRKYLYCIKDFTDFLISENYALKHGFVFDVLQTQVKLKQWRKNYSKQEKAQKHIWNDEDVEMFITPKQVDAYYKRNVAEWAKDLMSGLRNQTKTTVDSSIFLLETNGKYTCTSTAPIPLACALTCSYLSTRKPITTA